MKIVQRTVEGSKRFYLSYSYEVPGSVEVFERELGFTQFPQDFNYVTERFIIEIFKKRWSLNILEIKNEHAKTLNQQPVSLKEKNLENFGVRFTYDSQKIEGSTLSLRETELAIKEKSVPISKPLRDIQEAQRHMKCFEDLISTDSELSMDLVKKWHETLFSAHPHKNLFAGIVRKERVFISGSDFVPPSPDKVVPLLNELFKWYARNKKVITPVLLACLTSYRFVKIHPFLDGNGRTSRLIMNYILHKNNCLMFNISADTKKLYYNALEKAQLGFELKGNEIIFVDWFCTNYIDQS